jgi:hypothetical protein
LNQNNTVNSVCIYANDKEKAYECNNSDAYQLGNELRIKKVVKDGDNVFYKNDPISYQITIDNVA